MQHFEGSFAGAGGLALYYQTWYPTQTVKATVGILHGLGSHSGWFRDIAAALVRQDYAVYGMDLRGHGRSPGRRAYINHWAEFRDDCDRFRQLMLNQHPDLPCFALGHSLGAIILLDAVLQGQALSGLVLMAPSLNPTGVPPWRLAIGQVLSRVYPKFTLDTGIPPGAGSRDLEMIAAYSQDPLRHRKGTARLVTEFFMTVEWIKAHLHQLQPPVLILHGSQDIVTPSANSRVLFDQLLISDKEYHEYAEAYHDLHTDLDMPQVATDISNWLDRQIQHELNQEQRSDRLLLS